MPSEAMIEHLVLFKWKADVTGDQILRIEQALRSLRHKIPGIVELTCGRNISPRGKGFATGLYVRFQSQGDLEIYATHREHVHVVDTLVKPSLEDIVVSDFAVS